MLRLPQLSRWLLAIGLIYLITFTLLRLVLFWLDGQHSYSLAALGDAFFLGLRYDLRIISIVLFILLIIGSIPALHPFKSKYGRVCWLTLFALVTAFFVIFFALDFAHYAYLEQRLNASVLNYLQDAGISFTMVWQSYPVLRLLLVLVVSFLLLNWCIRYTYRRISRQNKPVYRKTRLVSFIVLFLLTGFFIFGRFNQYPLRWSDAFAFGSDYKANIALNPFQSFFSTLKFRNSIYDEKRVKALFPVLTKYYPIALSPGDDVDFSRTVQPDSTALTTQPNIVLVIAESFSMYKSSMSGNPLNTTPFFDSLCANGLFYDRCFTPSYGTARGVWATITGIPDVEKPKTASRNPLAVDQHTIINDFKGYEKFYFLGGSTSWANIRGVLTNNIQGLHLYEEEDYSSEVVDVWGISDKDLFKEANAVLGKQQKPFFAVIQTAGNHRPYTIPGTDLKAFTKQQAPADSLKRYGFDSEEEFNAFRYTDYCFRRFMEAAMKEKYYRNTLFVFIGDHGIPGDATHIYPAAWTAQRLTAEHVPLLFYAPGLIPAKRDSMICSQVDVLPTIAGFTNITYTNTTLGRNLRDTGITGFAFIFDPDNNMAGVIKNGFYFRKQSGTNKEELVPVTRDAVPLKTDSFITVTNEMRLLTEALLETSKYMLQNNKKGK